jgi:predicted DNA-binding protein
MSSTRTQIYLTDDQRRRIDRLAEAKGLTMAEVVRRAVDDYLDDEPDAELALRATFGAAPRAQVPSRDDWQRG